MNNSFIIKNGILEKYVGSDVNVIVPEGVTEIDYYAFDESPSIETVVLPDGLKLIGTAAFCNCKNLSSVIVPESVTVIENSAFEGCSNLKGITIPKGIQKIDAYAFAGCENGFVIVNNILFDYNGKNENVIVPKCVKTISERAFNGEKVRNVIIQEGVTRIGEFAFLYCKELENIIIPDSVRDRLYGFW